ncbi:eCIS core domain-containing protein [Deinococcus multiflagellatus]|uniref:DUF4157 domain-containing protein n=1 Tax=Deinococcus multiflagellatus TaxID=1656887 RepID=A0ABW1ZL36_9DEIO|nr:DUF4157 domain-containing protein [Deinococcus multiflagellatus]MBZ9713927.1 DUF4157 domain-containing protein [Deinococcus multiflagellatus]
MTGPALQIRQKKIAQQQQSLPSAYAIEDQAVAHAQRALQRHTARPVALQRQAAGPVLRASGLEQQEVTRLTVQRQAVIKQLAALPQIEGQPLQRAAQPVPAKPQSPADWVTVMRHQAEQVEGQALDTRQYAQFTALQRQVANTLVQGFRSDRGPAQARYDTYGEHLATLQRHEISAPVSRVVLGLVPAGERLALQRAVDTAVQRYEAEAELVATFVQRQSLQRQLAELDAEATQPVLQRIQARRGAGNPLPEPIQRHLEQGLNHDLSRVRIHDDAEADTLAKGVNALAFTTGSDIFFQSGKFNPNSQSGLELLAHEVTHTVQQSQGRVGPGVDPDAGLEAEARSMGAKLAQQATGLPHSQAHSRGLRQRPALTPTTTVQRRAAGTPAPAVTTVQRVGIIKHSEGANVRATPDPKGKLLLPQPLPVGKRVGVISQTADGWSRVALPSGRTGYVQSSRVTTNIPDPGASLIKVPAGMTAIEIAEKYYKAVVRPGQDLRFYVNVLAFLDQQRGTGAFKKQELVAGRLLWVPSAPFAQSLVGQVGSGSITGGALAQAKAAMGNSPGANVLRSVLESPTYIKEVLGEAWNTVKAHWPVMLATTVALVSAELLVGVLAAAPEPTTITKFLAVGLQGLITIVAGAGVAVSLAAAVKSGEMWLRTAWTAQGNASRIKAASKAFLGMIAQVVAAIASVAGVKASAAKTQALAGMYTREALIAQIGSKATYEALMNTLVARGIKQNNAQLLGALIKKVPDPLELKGFLRKVDKPVEFLATLEKYPLNRVRQVLAEIDSQSIAPQYATRLLQLNLENPVPTKPLTAERAAFLKEKFPQDSADKMFGGRSAVLREELTPQQLARDKLAGQQYQALLNDILANSPYVYRYTTRFALQQLREKGKDVETAFMTNVMVKNPNDVSLGTQLKPEWYKYSDGNPDVVIKIPRGLLSRAEVPRPSGNTSRLAGWEFTTSAYPEAGKGGMLQFMGSVPNNILEKGIKNGDIEIIYLTGGTSRLPQPK